MTVGEGVGSSIKSVAYNSLSQAPEEWEEEPAKPCSGEKLLLMFDRCVCGGGGGDCPD